MVSFRKPKFSLLLNFMLSNRWLVVQVEQLTEVLRVWASVSSCAGVGGRVGAGVGVWVWTAPVLRVPCARFQSLESLVFGSWLLVFSFQFLVFIIFLVFSFQFLIFRF